MVNQVMRFVNDEEGATAIEYGLLAALIAAVIVTAVTAVGTSLSGTFNPIAGSVAASSEKAPFRRGTWKCRSRYSVSGRHFGGM
jgi:pilus assembly protein Flp/PilA